MITNTIPIKQEGSKFFHNSKEVDIPDRLKILLKGKPKTESIFVKVEDVIYI